MENNQEANAVPSSFTRGELLQASIDLTHHALSYVKSMALRCAVQLGVADAIRRAGGEASVDGLAAALSLAPTKLPHLRRVMRVLAASGVFAEATGSGEGYRLTPVSTLLLTDGGGDGCRSLQQLARFELSPFCVSPVTNLAEWFAKDDETPFAMTFGTDLWDFCSRNPGFSEFFNGAMACDSRLVMDAVVHEMGDIFDGVTSMVDVAGGTGGAAKAVAAAFPHIKCTVLDLPHVIHGIPADDGQVVEFVAGDMMEFIPQADALLLKFVLHDWSDEDCLTFLNDAKRRSVAGNMEESLSSSKWWLVHPLHEQLAMKHSSCLICLFRRWYKAGSVTRKSGLNCSRKLDSVAIRSHLCWIFDL